MCSLFMWVLTLTGIGTKLKKEKMINHFNKIYMGTSIPYWSWENLQDRSHIKLFQTSTFVLRTL